MKRFTKIHHNPNTMKTEFAWEITGPGAADKATSERNGEPPDSFLAALATLTEHVAEIVDRPIEVITVYGVLLGYKQDILHARFSCVEKLPHDREKLSWVTMSRAAMPYKEDDEEQAILSPECTEALGILVKEAEAYPSDEDAQLNLFDPSAQVRVSGGQYTTQPPAVRSMAN